MTRRDKFKQLCDRMKSPDNKERYKQWKECPDKSKGDYLIEMHIKHIQDYLKAVDGELKQWESEVIEISFDAALKSVERLLNENNWQ